MFPIAATIMYWGYRNTNSKTSIVLMALIAALIKSVNFFMPGLPPIKTYNPMISIMLQALVVYSFVPLFEAKSLSLRLLTLPLASFLWRSLFIANIAINNALTAYPFTQLANAGTILTFIFLSGLIEAALLIGALSLRQGLKKKVTLMFEAHWLLSLAMFIGAVLVAALPLL